MLMVYKAQILFSLPLPQRAAEEEAGRIPLAVMVDLGEVQGCITPLLVQEPPIKDLTEDQKQATLAVVEAVQGK